MKQVARLKSPTEKELNDRLGELEAQGCEILSLSCAGDGHGYGLGIYVFILYERQVKE